MNHTRNTYALGFLALAIAGGGEVYQAVKPAPVERVSPFAWPGLNDAQEAAMTAAFAAIGSGIDITIWCEDVNCTDLAEDLQYDAYQAGWATHAERPVLPTGLPGMAVTPDDATGQAIAKALNTVAGLQVDVVTTQTDRAGKYNIVIGKR